MVPLEVDNSNFLFFLAAFIIFFPFPLHQGPSPLPIALPY